MGSLVWLLALAREARADIDPPRGLDWLHQPRFLLENAGDFPDYVFVSWPCTTLGARPFSMSDTTYCILQPNESHEWQLDPTAMLLAVRAGSVKVAYDPKGSFNGGAWLFSEPKVAPGKEAPFFDKDRRVVRPGYKFDAPWSHTVPEAVGLSEATYFVRIDSVSDEGLKAHFARVVYRCSNGREVEAPGNASWQEPTIPACPPTSEDPHPSLPDESTLPPPARGGLWLGVLVASLSLLLGGVMLRSEAKAKRAKS